MSEVKQQAAAPALPIEATVAGWFLLAAAVWELLWNRLASALGLYAGLGAEGPLVWLADSGELAMNSVGIMSLVLLCATLPRLANNPAFALLPWRVVLMLTSPLYLPVIFVSIFRSVSQGLILLGYLAAALSAFLIALLCSVRRIGSSRRRIFIALGLIEILPAIEIAARYTGLVDPADSFGVITRRAYLFAEVMLAVVPVFAFFALGFGRLRSFVRRPHLLASIAAAVALGIGIWAAVHTGARDFLSLSAYRTLGITIAIPGTAGLVIYLIGLFFGTLLTGALILPSRRWPPNTSSRRVGLGLLCIFSAGIQPIHPYQFALMILGFVLLARGFFDPVPGEASAGARESLLDREPGSGDIQPEGTR